MTNINNEINIPYDKYGFFSFYNHEKATLDFQL